MAFPVTCPSCGKAFQLAADVYERKVAGKIVSIKCKQCQTGIRVDATEPGTLKVVGMTPPGGGGEMSVGPKPPEAPQAKAAPAAPAAAAAAPPAAQAAPAASTPMRMRQPTLIGMVSPTASAQTPAVAAPKPAPPPPLLWAVDSGGVGDDRELSDEEIRLEIQAGTVTPQTLVWRDGMDEWLEIEKVPDLQKFLAPARPEPKPAQPAPAPREQPAPAPREQPAPKVQHTGFEEEADAEPTMIYDRSAPNASFEPFPASLREKETTARVMLSETARLAETAPDQETTTRLVLSQTAKLAETPPAPPLPAAGRPAAFGQRPPIANAQRPPIANAQRPPIANAPPAPLAETPPAPPAETPRPPLADSPRPPLADSPRPPVAARPPLANAPRPPMANAPRPPMANAQRPPLANAPPAPLADAPPPPLPAVARPIGLGKTTPLGDAPPPPPLAARPPPPLAARPAPPVQPAPAPQPEPPPQAAPEFFEQAAPEPEPLPPPLPRPPAQAPVLAGVPWGDALPSAKPAIPALPTAYAPDPFAVAATTDLDFPNPRSKKPLVIAAIVGVVAVIGIGIAIASSSSPPAANIAAPPPVPTMARTVEAKPTEPTPTSEPARDEPSGTNAPTTQPQTPSGNFSDLFSKGVKGGSAAGGKGFDEAAARAALADLLKAAAACKEPGGPVGQASATITFEPGGSVSGVTVGAPFAGSSTATCIVTTFKRAKIAPFNGLPGTVSQVISLR